MDNSIKKFANKIGLPMFTVMAVFLTGIFSITAGAFMYATGDQVVNSVYMQMVSKTEYRFAEEGQVIARLVNFQGIPINVINCTADIVYPNKTYFVNEALMNASLISGDHFYNFTTPEGPEGVYEYQATCFYNVGVNVRNTSVTNSFHLSGAFNSIFNNLSDVRDDIVNLSLQLDANVTTILNEIGIINTTINTMNTTINTMNTTINMEFADIQINFSDVFDLLNVINTSVTPVNLTPVLDAIDLLNLTMNNRFDIVDNNLVTITTNIGEINTTTENIFTLLQNVNVTTTNTFNYMTGTLTNLVNDVLTDLGVINATVNKIETVVNVVNETTQQILLNQEEEVRMNVFSG